MKAICVLLGMVWSVMNLSATETVTLVTSNKTGHQLDEYSSDLVRQNLIHIFDSASFHQAKGGKWPEKSQKEIEKELEKVQGGSHFELTLDEPAKIVVERRTFKVVTLWAGISSADGFVNAWICKQQPQWKAKASFTAAVLVEVIDNDAEV